MEELPQYSNSKKKGNKAADILKKTLDNFCIVNIHDESIDLGIDMRAQVIEGVRPTPMFFNIQSKGKDEIDSIKIEKEYYSATVKVATVNYWRQQNDTTFLFVVDNETENCYWCNPLHQLNDKLEAIQKNKYVTLRIPFDNCIDSKILNLPDDFIKYILIYSVIQSKKNINTIEKINAGLNGKYKIDIPTSVYIVKELKKLTDNIRDEYYAVCKSVIQNIRSQLNESYDYANRLGQITELVNKYCPNGIKMDKGFTSSGKSLKEIEDETNSIIELFEKNIDNTDLLDELIICDKEAEDILRNIGAFLYEMECEDNPWGNHDELYKMTWGRKWRY